MNGAHRRDQALRPQVVHHGFLLEVEGSHGLQAMDSAGHEEEGVANKKWECQCGNTNHPDAEDCARCGHARDDDSGEEIPVSEREHPDLAVLRELKPSIVQSKDAGLQRLWNESWTRAKSGQDLRRGALDRLRAHGSRQAADRIHRRHGADAEAQDECQAVADDLVAKADAFLGQDMAETTAQLRTAKRTCRSFDARRSPSENLVAAAEALGEEMRNRRY
ncbi:MAG: zinc finger Ran-binding domain-containing protein [Terriglobales bacterium]